MDSYALENGTVLTIRRIDAGDRERLRASHAALSPESRYRRFLATKPELTNADARYLVEVDGSDHFALVAIRSDLPGEPIVAVARYVRLPDDPAAAEFAIVVGDPYHRQGLAGELMRRLADVAVRHGVVRFRATMLADNLAIHRLVAGVARGPVRQQYLGSLSEVEFDLTPIASGERIPFPAPGDHEANAA